nr:immunoglobulin light chain junction region [Macaca mulatta]MOX83687.1 immunoglobulin light chain junction region [Macaca mulatta]MOX84007.1 immunoglobulin light chain junction region [Macaca mulatta]
DYYCCSYAGSNTFVF